MVMSGPPITLTSAAVAPRYIDIKKRRTDRFLDRVCCLVLAVTFAHPDHGDTAALHDRAHIGKIKVDEAGHGDQFGDPLDGPHEDFVCDLECRIEREFRDDFERAGHWGRQ